MALSNEDIERIMEYAKSVIYKGGPFAYYPEEILIDEACRRLKIATAKLTKKQRKELVKAISEIELANRSSLSKGLGIAYY